MDPIAQAKNTASVLIGEARARRGGHGFWCMFRMAPSARRRDASLNPAPIAGLPAARITQTELFA